MLLAIVDSWLIINTSSSLLPMDKHFQGIDGF